MDAGAEGERGALLLERTRTQLTIIRGFAALQQRGQEPVLTATARIEGAVQQLTRLLDDYEQATQPQIRRPRASGTP